MKTPLAWLNLVHQKTRTLVAVAGAAFAIILIFLQLGFYGSIEATATVIYDELDFDLLVVSARYIDMNRSGTFPRAYLYQARTDPRVEAAVPLHLGFLPWRNPEYTGDFARKRRTIMVLGLRPGDPVFRRGRPKHVQEDLDRHRGDLLQPGKVLIDRLSREEFGPQRVGQRTEVGTTAVEIAGQFTLGAGFGADGVLLVSDATFARIYGGMRLDRTNFGLVQLKPGADPDEVARYLRESLPPGVQVLTRDELGQRERRHWTWNTSLGLIFFLGVGVAFLVGVAFVYQVVASDIRSRLHEFATLKALGYGANYLSGVVLQQVVLLAVLGYVPGLLVALGLYALARAFTNIPIGMTLGRAALVLGLAVAMCALSGLFALRKVRSADPADLF